MKYTDWEEFLSWGSKLIAIWVLGIFLGAITPPISQAISALVSRWLGV